MLAEERSSKLKRGKLPIESGIVPPIYPPSLITESTRDVTLLEVQVTPLQLQTSVVGEPKEQDQPVRPRDPILVALITSHILAS